MSTLVTPQNIYLVCAIIVTLLAACYLLSQLDRWANQDGTPHYEPRRSPPEMPSSASGRRNLRIAQNGGHHTEREWQVLCQQFNGRCAKCRCSAPLTKDHIVPVSLGGSDNISNIQPLCRSCNSAKGTRIIDYRGAQ